jgi:hypothetical protein
MLACGRRLLRLVLLLLVLPLPLLLLQLLLLLLVMVLLLLWLQVAVAACSCGHMLLCRWSKTPQEMRDMFSLNGCLQPPAHRCCCCCCCVLSTLKVGQDDSGDEGHLQPQRLLPASRSPLLLLLLLLLYAFHFARWGKTAQEMKDRFSLNSFYLNGADGKQYYYTHLQVRERRSQVLQLACHYHQC